MMTIDLHCGDCLDVLKTLNDESVDLIITSPPYADARKKQYGGVSCDEYVNWFMPISAELLRVLKPTGSFVLNIKEKCVNGERSTYVLELILALRKQGWKWVEEYIWHKKNPMCGKWKNRFRDGFERCLHFTKTLNFNMYQDEVKIPAKESTIKRSQRLNDKNDIIDHAMANGSGFHMNHSHFVGRDMVYPDNVLYMSCETRNQKHPAVFPCALPEWFVKLFTVEDDVVFDPFMGSGTTGVVCKRLNRNFIGCDIKEEYLKLATERIDNA